MKTSGCIALRSSTHRRNNFTIQKSHVTKTSYIKFSSFLKDFFILMQMFVSCMSGARRRGHQIPVTAVTSGCEPHTVWVLGARLGSSRRTATATLSLFLGVCKPPCPSLAAHPASSSWSGVSGTVTIDLNIKLLWRCAILKSCPVFNLYSKMKEIKTTELLFSGCWLQAVC